MELSSRPLESVTAVRQVEIGQRIHLSKILILKYKELVWRDEYKINPMTESQFNSIQTLFFILNGKTKTDKKNIIGILKKM